MRLAGIANSPLLIVEGVSGSWWVLCPRHAQHCEQPCCPGSLQQSPLSHFVPGAPFQGLFELSHLCFGEKLQDLISFHGRSTGPWAERREGLPVPCSGPWRLLNLWKEENKWHKQPVRGGFPLSRADINWGEATSLIKTKEFQPQLK